MHSLKLICDTRERKIQDRINSEFSKPFIFAKSKGYLNCCIRQLQIGDYLIVEEIDDTEKILAVIERKTLKDYGASFKDGRHNNKAKLLNLKSTSGCKIFYIIEGPLNPDYCTEYAGIKFQNIHASEHDLMIENDIMVLRTQDGEHTARELKMLCESYLRVISKGVNVCEDFTGDERAKLTFDELMKKSVFTPEEELQKSKVLAWATIPRVGEPTAEKVAAEFKLCDWILGNIDIEKISSFTYNGRKNNSLINALSLKPNLEMQVNILSQLKGFSKKSAMELLTQISLEEILLDNEKIKDVRLGKRGNKLTAERCEKIKLFLS